MSFWEQIAAIDRRLDDISYYELLGVDSAAPGSAILDRYYYLAARLHPDRHARAGKPQRQTLSRVHARLSEARRVLSSPELRGRYDRGLAAGRRRLDRNEEERRAPAGPDPKHPVARKFFAEAKRLHAAGDSSGARSRLELARHYEPESAAVARAIAALVPSTSAKPSATTTPAATPPTATTPAANTAAPPPATAPPPAAAKPSATATTSPPAPRRPPPTAPPPIPSRRVHDRHRVGLPVRLRIPTWDRLRLLYTRDVSRGGMFLQSERALPLGTLLELSIVAPTGDTLELRATVVHHRTAGGVPGMGLRFEDVTDELLGEIASLLASAEDATEPDADANAGADARAPLEELVSELVRLRELPAHQVLGVPEDADHRVAGAAYATLARRFHPMRNGADTDPMRAEVCRELLECVRRAYEQFGRR